MKQNLVLFFAFALGGFLHSNQPDDGAWWKLLSKDAKQTYVLGVRDGYELVTIPITSFVFSSPKYDETTKKRMNCVKEISEVMMSFAEKYLTKASVAQIVNGMDTIYNDYRNQKIKSLHVLYLAAYSISGASEEQQQILAEHYRRKDVSEVKAPLERP